MECAIKSPFIKLPENSATFAHALGGRGRKRDRIGEMARRGRKRDRIGEKASGCQRQLFLKSLPQFPPEKGPSLLPTWNTEHGLGSPPPTPAPKRGPFSLREAEVEAEQSSALFNPSVWETEAVGCCGARKTHRQRRGRRHFPSSFWLKKKNRETLNTKHHLPVPSKYVKPEPLLTSKPTYPF